MNKTWNNLVSRATLTFTLAAVFTALYNLTADHPQGNYLFLIELLGFIVCLEVIDYALSYVPFPTRIIYLCAESALMYICFLIFGFFGHWFGFTTKNLVIFTITFLVMFLLLHKYDHFLLKSEATDINNKLDKRKTK